MNERNEKPSSLRRIVIILAIGASAAHCSGSISIDDPTLNPDGGAIPPGNNVNGRLVISPHDALITITDRSSPESQQFSATFDGNPTFVRWSLSKYDTGQISTRGLFTTSGIVAGTFDVVASFGDIEATAKVRVAVNIREVIDQGPSDPGVPPGNKTTLDESPTLEPAGERTRILYPYNKTVMPRGIVAPLIQFNPGKFPGEDAKITLVGGDFSWTGYFHITDRTLPRFSVPQPVWDAALLSRSGEKLTVSLTKVAAGRAYGPATTEITVAPGALRGAVYYQTYEETHLGLWVARPGRQEPAKHIITGCAVCHSTSGNGKWLAAGATGNDGHPNDAQLTGIYKINPDFSITKTSGAPAGLGGDSRGISFAAFTPDGKYLMRSKDNFWGGPNQLGWRINDNGTLTAATVNGLAGVSAFVPSFSPDGKRFLFTTGTGDNGGTNPLRSLNVMDVAVDDAARTLTFSNRRVVLDNGAQGAKTRFGTFLPDANKIVLQEGTGEDHCPMCPTVGGGGYGTSEGRLFLVDTKASQHIELAKANTGLVPADRTHNYEPFALPVKAAGYYWVVFTSIRQFGNVQVGAQAKKQLWVAAISPGDADDSGAVMDPSHPPFYLPNQTPSKNERGFWALEACIQAGKACTNQDDCCSGICAPENPTQPSSRKVCQTDELTCVRVGESCEVTAECCDAASGIVCDNGTCRRPSTPVL